MTETPENPTVQDPMRIEISSTAVMMEARAEQESSWHRRLLLAQENLLLKSMVGERDLRIEELSKDINDRDAHSVAVDRDLESKDARIAELELHLADRDTRIGSMQHDIDAMGRTIRALEAEAETAGQRRGQEAENRS